MNAHEILTPVVNRAKGYDEDARCVDCDAIGIHFVEHDAPYDVMCHAHFVRRFGVCDTCGRLEEKEDVLNGTCGWCEFDIRR